MTSVDVLVIGAGPAGLSAALNLARSRHRVLVVDSNRPRNAATMLSHGFITRDGIPPHELRTLARVELEQYPEVEIAQRSSVVAVERNPDGGPHRFIASVKGPGPAAPSTVEARVVLVATGLREVLPEVPGIRGFYGMSLFSCAACDGYEQSERPLALIGESDDLLMRALLLAQWSDTVTVFTNGSAAISADDALVLAERGIALRRERITELVGARGQITELVLESGERLPVTGGFVRPEWHPALEFVSGLGLELDHHGNLATDRSGRTGEPGLYAAGDVAAPGPQQLIVAAGAGARSAAVITHDLLGVTTSH